MWWEGTFSVKFLTTFFCRALTQGEDDLIWARCEQGKTWPKVANCINYGICYIVYIIQYITVYVLQKQKHANYSFYGKSEN